MEIKEKLFYLRSKLFYLCMEIKPVKFKFDNIGILYLGKIDEY